MVPCLPGSPCVATCVFLFLPLLSLALAPSPLCSPFVFHYAWAELIMGSLLAHAPATPHLRVISLMTCPGLFMTAVWCYSSLDHCRLQLVTVSRIQLSPMIFFFPRQLFFSCKQISPKPALMSLGFFPVCSSQWRVCGLLERFVDYCLWNVLQSPSESLSESGVSVPVFPKPCESLELWFFPSPCKYSPGVCVKNKICKYTVSGLHVSPFGQPRQK